MRQKYVWLNSGMTDYLLYTHPHYFAGNRGKPLAYSSAGENSWSRAHKQDYPIDLRQITPADTRREISKEEAMAILLTAEV